MTTVHICASCATVGLTCCQGCDRTIYITLGDVKRIEAFIGENDFYEFRQPEHAGYLDNIDDPIWETYVFRADKSRRVLKRNNVGDCGFLTKVGCRLPMDIRPLVCRLHPFEYNASGLFAELSKECPVHLLREGETLQKAVDISPESANIWHKALYQEILWEKQDVEHRTDV
ncbi:hypothetical protein KKA14_06000 [bacterium]|nr:hypothetical protein [bacterium]